MAIERDALNDIRPSPSSGRFVNSGNGPTFQPLDIGHPGYIAVVEPDTAFWSLIPREKAAEAFTGDILLDAWRAKARGFASEMETLRFGLKPSAVYFNPTERCNLDCPYCYIPSEMRRDGQHMDEKDLLKALGLLKEYFGRTLDREAAPQVIFHGAEPLLNRDAVFAGIDEYHRDFRFGVQTNATTLDDGAAEFLKSRGVSIGISLDAPTAEAADLTRRGWDGRGVYPYVVEAMERLRGYDRWSVICTITSENMAHLTDLVDFFHTNHVPTCLMNIVRCTLPSSRDIKPGDLEASRHFLAALDRTRELYRQTGRKLPVANFANILLAIVAPQARRLMCDISPCGGGRCFFALTPAGDLFPCSEFIGVDAFRGGNIFTDDIDDVLSSAPFERVTGRKVEDIDACSRCAIRHFCGSPCPAEASEMNGGMEATGAFCEFYEEQVRYAFRLIADGTYEDYLWDGWEEGTESVFDFGCP